MPPKAIHKKVHNWNNETQQGIIYHQKMKIRVFRDKVKNPFMLLNGITLHVRFQDSDIIAATIDGREILVIPNAVLYLAKPNKAKTVLNPKATEAKAY